jgi:2-phosphosulfolactate phosphatase
MRIARERLIDGAARSEGAVIVVDVIRAFTTAAFALAVGPRELRLFPTVEEALAVKAREPGAFLMGEDGGAPPPGFDHGNSPALLPVNMLRDRLVLQRTGSGTRCAVAATKASHLYAASLVVAQATARAVARLSPDLVTIVESGGADEGDDAVADHIEGLLRSEPPPIDETLQRVRGCRAVREIVERARAHSPPQDIACCTSLDFFDFAIRVERGPHRVLAYAEDLQRRGSSDRGRRADRRYPPSAPS